MSSRVSRPVRPLPSLPLRLLVVLLAMVQFVAPTWHVCSLGGHVMAMQPGSGHHGGMATAQVDPDAPMQALICYCAPKHEIDPDASRLSATVSHDEHVSCLALLLQTMPGAVAAPAAPLHVGVPIQFRWEAVAEVSPSFSLLPRSRGRAPPVSC